MTFAAKPCSTPAGCLAVVTGLRLPAFIGVRALLTPVLTYLQVDKSFVTCATELNVLQFYA